MSPQRTDDPNQRIQRYDEVVEREDDITTEDRSAGVSTPDGVVGGKIAQDRVSFQRDSGPHLDAQGLRPEPLGKYFDSDIAPLRQQHANCRENPPPDVNYPTEQRPEKLEGRPFRTDAAPPQGGGVAVTPEAGRRRKRH